MKHFIILLLLPYIAWAQSDFQRGESFFQQKKYDAATSCFKNYLKKHPDDSKAIEYLGDIAGYQQKWDDAISYYSKLKSQFPKTANYHYKFGGALGMKAREVNKFEALGMIGDVKSAFETAAKLDPKHIDTRWALVVLYLELPGIIGGSEAKAQKYADELMQLSKVDGYLAKGYIDVYFKRYQKAEGHYRKAHEIGNSKTTFDKLYDLYLNKLKDKTKAVKLRTDFEKH